MKRLWAPWRMEYIEGKREKGCIFCTYPKKKNQAKALILAQTSLSFVILNKYPYNNGHLMIVPKRHLSKFEDLNSEEGLDVFLVLQKTVEILNGVLKPEGLNIGMNIGRAAGAGIDKHLHYHVVPRWKGDANFMPVVAHMKVISESLDKTYRKLYPYFSSKK